MASDGKYSLIENSSLTRENENNNMEFSVKKTNGNSYVENLPIETNSVKNDISLPSKKMNVNLLLNPNLHYQLGINHFIQEILNLEI